MIAYKATALLSAVLFVSGCSVFDGLIFVTKSSIGLDMDSIPPATDLSVDRQEGVLSPTFEGGQTPPIMGSFKSSTNPFLRFFGMGIATTYATGDAAVVMAKLYSTSDDEVTKLTKHTRSQEGYWTSRDTFLRNQLSSDIALTEKPKSYQSVLSRLLNFLYQPSNKSEQDQDIHTDRFVEPGESKLLVFSTDTLLGVKVQYDGTVAGVPFPTGIQVGFNRKEFSWAPLGLCSRPKVSNVPAYIASGDILTASASTENISKIKGEIVPSSKACDKIDEMAGPKEWVVKTPSLLATYDSKANLTEANGDDNEVRLLQYFATGEAATQLAFNHQVRQKFLERILPGETGIRTAVKKAYQASSTQIKAIVDASNKDDELELIYYAGKKNQSIETIPGFNSMATDEKKSALRKSFEESEAKAIQPTVIDVERLIKMLSALES